MAVELAALELAIYETGADPAIAKLRSLNAAGEAAATGMTKTTVAAEKTGGAFAAILPKAEGAERGLTRIERSMAGIGIAASGADPHIAHLLVALSSFGYGAGFTLAVVAGFTLIAEIIKRVGEESRAAAEDLKKLQQELDTSMITPGGASRLKEGKLQDALTEKQQQFQKDFDQLLGVRGMTVDQAQDIVTGKSQPPAFAAATVSGLVDRLRSELNAIKQLNLEIGKTQRDTDDEHQKAIDKAEATRMKGVKLLQEEQDQYVLLIAEIDQTNSHLIAQSALRDQKDLEKGSKMFEERFSTPWGLAGFDTKTEWEAAQAKQVSDLGGGVGGPAATTLNAARAKELKTMQQEIRDAERERVEQERMLRDALKETGDVIKKIIDDLISGRGINAGSIFKSLLGFGINALVGYATGGIGNLITNAALSGALASAESGISAAVQTGQNAIAGFTPAAALPTTTVGGAVAMSIGARVSQSTGPMPTPAPAVGPFYVFGERDPVAQRMITSAVAGAMRRGYSTGP